MPLRSIQLEPTAQKVCADADKFRPKVRGSTSIAVHQANHWLSSGIIAAICLPKKSLQTYFRTGTSYSSGEVNPERRPHRHYTEAIRDAVSHVCLLDDRLLFCNDLEFLKTAIDVHKQQESSALGERLKKWAKRQARDQDRIMFYLNASSVGPVLDSLLKQRPLQKMQTELDYDESEIKVFRPINQLGGSVISLTNSRY